jgi:hypothetical protein
VLLGLVLQELCVRERYVMKGSLSLRQILLVLPLLLIFACTLSTIAGAQAVPQFPAPSNPLSPPASPSGLDGIPVSSGMLSPYLPRIPNLELGFLYSFGNNVRTGRFTADYTRPFHLSPDSVLFGEAHGEGWDFWEKPNVSITTPAGFTTTTLTANNRVDLSFGGGYRTMLRANTLVGVNGFYDTSHLFNRWYSSGGVGLEMAANVAGDDAIDLDFNWYGSFFNKNVLINAFRNKGNSFDVQAGYSHALFNRALDLRLKVIGYRFDIGTAVQGWRGGADLTSRNGMLTLRYEHGRDQLNGDYNTVGGFVTVGCQLENLLSGESPFTIPEPVFRSPRNLRRMLGLKVKRNWHQPEAVVLARSNSNPTPATSCNLQGSTVITTAFPYDTLLTTVPEIPSLSSTTSVLICWCGARADFPGLQFHFSDGTNGRNTSNTEPPVVITKGAGCVLRDLQELDFPSYSNGVLQVEGGSLPLYFEPGGGVSFSFQ